MQVHSYREPKVYDGQPTEKSHGAFSIRGRQTVTSGFRSLALAASELQILDISIHPKFDIATVLGSDARRGDEYVAAASLDD
jgi:hypothetical protein